MKRSEEREQNIRRVIHTAQMLFIADGNVLEEGPPATFFHNPTHPRLQDFLRKVL